MDDKNWIDFESSIDSHLSLQVELMFESHFSYLKRHGLETCGKVIDIGTGNGCFLEKMAGFCPEIQFIGTDCQDHMLSRAMKRNSRNIRWAKGDINNPCTIPGITSADGVLMRFVALHLNDVRNCFSKLADELKNGALLWILDLDLNKFACSTGHIGFTKYIALLERFCEKYSPDSHACTDMPGILEQTGFEMLDYSVDEMFDNRNSDLRLFREFFVQELNFYAAFLNEDRNSDDYKDMLGFIDDAASHPERFCFRYGVSFMTARKI